MQTSQQTKYIFQDEAVSIFFEKLECFHEYFVDLMLLDGEADNGSNIYDIDFYKNPIHEDLVYEILIAGMEAIKPEIICRGISAGRLGTECAFFDFGESFGISHIYMMKNTMDWTSKKNFYCQVWSLQDVSLNTLTNYWRS